MIRLRKIEILINEEFETEKELAEFKKQIAADIARRMKKPPTVYNSFETHENKLVFNT